MKNPYLMGAMVLLSVLFASSASAATVNLEPLLDPLAQLLALVVTALVTVITAQLSIWLQKHLKISNLKIEDDFRRYLNDAAINGLNLAAQKVRTSGMLNVDVKNQMVGMAASYVVARTPDALKKFNLSPEDLQEYIEARISPVHEAVASGQAFTGTTSSVSNVGDTTGTSSSAATSTDSVG